VISVALVGCVGAEDDTNVDSAADATDSTGESGDGDGDTNGDGDGDTNGDGDGPANAACEAFANGTPEALIAATSAAEAATASVVPDSQVVYTVTLPEAAAGFIQLQIPDWETTQAFFTSGDIDYVITTDANAQVAQPGVPDAACPDAGIMDTRVFFPHWTPATIEFSAEGPREISLMIIQQ
jgi:hypothetical protein